MCGIFGVVGSYDEKTTHRSLELLRHRGPDGSGFLHLEAGKLAGLLQNGGCLGHTRLSIIDPLPEAAQPMQSSDGQIVVTFNGEIYNFNELKKELNYPFTTTSDTELIIAAYLEWGEACVERFVGMFAFALLDKRDGGKLYLFRDRFGKKPLFYSLKPDGVIFASEIKAILPHLNTVSLNHAALKSYLSYLAPVAPLSFYNEVQKLPAGYFLKIDESGISVNKYFELLQSKKRIFSEPQALEEIEELLIRSVSYRLVSDVEVGSFLSGGVDSSMVAAIAQSLKKERGEESLRTFCIGYDEYEEYDERHYARMVAGHIGSRHYEVQIGKKDFLSALDDVFYHLDEPLNDPACVPTYLLSQKLHEKGLKVALCGEGSDEAFLGYEKYFEYLKLLESASAIPHKNWFKNYMTEHPALNKEWEWYRRVFSGEVLFRTFGENYTDWQKQRFLRIPVSENDSLQYIAPYIEEFESSKFAMEPSVWQSYIDLKVWIGDVLLAKVDRMSMAHSLELRAPFLDHELVQTALGIAPMIRMGGGQNKYILKKIAQKYLPSEIVYRRKKGFSYPFNEWILQSGELDVIKEVNGKTGLFDEERIEFLLQATRKGSFKHHLWSVFSFCKWYKGEFL